MVRAANDIAKHAGLVRLVVVLDKNEIFN